ncbi:hypothetical protein ACOMHN_006827 [Nucella lapillus]
MSDVDAPLDAGRKAEEGRTADDKQQQQQTVVVDLSHIGVAHDTTPGVMSFAVEEHHRNTEDNPERENTNTLPVLVRRVNSEELLPSPFKTTNQMVIASYLTVICCLCFGAYAVKHAWEAKTKRNAGVLSNAAKESKRSCLCMKLALVGGVCLCIKAIVLLSIHFTVGL